MHCDPIKYEQSTLEIWNVSGLFDYLQPNINSYIYQGNRIIDQERVNVIENKIREDPGLLDGTQVHFALYNEKYIILDGQHRLSALERVKNTTPNIISNLKIEIKVYKCKTNEDVAKKFVELNDNHVPVPKKYIMNNVHDICSCVSAKLRKHFPKAIFSDSYSCHRPNINLKRFEETLSNQNIDWSTCNPNFLFDCIINHNKILSKYRVVDFLVQETPNELKIIKSAHKKALINGCYLGLIKDYRFIADINFNKPQKTIKKIVLKKKM